MKRYLEAVKGKTLLAYEEFHQYELQADHFRLPVDKYIHISYEAGKEGMPNPDTLAIMPTYMTDKAVGADCFASQTVYIEPGEVKIVPTGIKAKFNGDEEGLFPFIRSSLPKKKGVILANGVGVIEEDYYGNPDNDGEIGFMFLNFGKEPVVIRQFERIGQLVLTPIYRFENADYAGKTRGQSGSTGN